MQAGHEHEPHRLVQVQPVADRVQQRVRVTKIGEHGAHAGRLGEQALGVRVHHRIAVHVNTAAAFGDLVDVRARREAAADIEELPDARMSGQETGRAHQEPAVGHRVVQVLGGEPESVRRGRAVDLEVVLAAEPVVVDTCRMGDAGTQIVHWAGHPFIVDAAPRLEILFMRHVLSRSPGSFLLRGDDMT